MAIMNTTTQLHQLELRIAKLKSKLMALGEMRPGSISQQFNVCRSPGCRCKDPKHPQPHGPYYQLSYVRHGKSTSQAVPKDYVPQAQRQLDNYKLFRKLSDEWVELALQHARLSLDLFRRSQTAK